MKGYLDKHQPKAFLWGKWKPRYWVLKKDKFKYYIDKNSPEHLGVIDFNKVDVSIVSLPNKRHEFKISISGCKRDFSFRADNSIDAENWIKRFEECIASSRGRHLSLTLSDSKFWKKEYIDLNEFQNHADNWDLLLFKSKTYGTKLQRTFTGSDFDHVGMLVLWETDNDPNTIFLLEAVADEGVRLVEFIPNIEAYYEVYERIVFRPLQGIERDEELLIKLDEYLGQVLGKKYGVSMNKFWRNSVNHRGTDGKHIEEANRTFQWAELVAKMYKILGIIGSHEHSGKYIPAHFTEKKKIDLQKGSFGPEWVVYLPDNY